MHQKLDEVNPFRRSVASNCEECGSKIGADQKCYRVKDNQEAPHFVANDSRLLCNSCAKDF